MYLEISESDFIIDVDLEIVYSIDEYFRHRL